MEICVYLAYISTRYTFFRMAIINNQDEFLDWVKRPTITQTKEYFENNNYTVGEDMLFLKDLVIANLNLENKYFESTDFENCTFENCKLFHTFISSCSLRNCRFVDCEITWSKILNSDINTCQFEGCTIVGLEWSDIISEKVLLINCGEILDLQIRSGQQRDFIFVNCFLAFLKIERNKSETNEVDKFSFIECLINESSFNQVDMTKSEFYGCNLSLNQFTNCIFSAKTSNANNQTPSNEFNSVDIRTILGSVNQESEILERLFGIHNQEIKEYLIGITSKIQYQSIFISYSFSDKIIAKRINEDLFKRGILTFLWEKDAPAGRPLKDIMSTGVKEKDRVLFISSKNSLRSKACQYELTTGREKQEQIWENVLFPIHIDSYLFEVSKEKIRPIEMQSEYWRNIEELKQLNSLDFGDCFNKDGSVTDLYEKNLFKLIRGLRKEI